MYGSALGPWCLTGSCRSAVQQHASATKCTQQLSCVLCFMSVCCMCCCACNAGRVTAVPAAGSRRAWMTMVSRNAVDAERRAQHHKESRSRLNQQLVICCMLCPGRCAGLLATFQVQSSMGNSSAVLKASSVSAAHWLQHLPAMLLLVHCCCCSPHPPVEQRLYAVQYWQPGHVCYCCRCSSTSSPCRTAAAATAAAAAASNGQFAAAEAAAAHCRQR
jgi:hypothetical protein